MFYVFLCLTTLYTIMTSGITCNWPISVDVALLLGVRLCVCVRACVRVCVWACFRSCFDPLLNRHYERSLIPS